MADFDKAAHEMMRFRAGKYSKFERGRFLVAYHEDRLYSVRDTKRGTVTLVEARNPKEAYRVIVRPVVRGEWVEDDYGFIHCSICGMEWDEPEHPKTNFCPNCGADMREVKTNEK